MSKVYIEESVIKAYEKELSKLNEQIREMNEKFLNTVNELNEEHKKDIHDLSSVCLSKDLEIMQLKPKAEKYDEIEDYEDYDIGLVRECLWSYHHNMNMENDSVYAEQYRKVSLTLDYIKYAIKERDEALKRIEKLEAKVMQYESLRIEDVLAYEGSKGKLTNADYKCLYINTLKRINELEKENAELLKANSYNNDITNKISAEKHKLELNYKVLVDVLRVYDYGFDGNTIFRCGWFYTDECMKIVDWRKQLFKDYNINEDDFKAMLELVEVEE